ncbi:MAG TPA: cysteine desulfurase family protein [Candidatus Paceibacterota bacterium]|nr:cysteine desulfurase family protein [Candidatus Paceibacterota bacterium]
MKRIYLDYAATTPVDRRVLNAMAPYFAAKSGNPGSLHAFGQEAIAAVDRSREAVAKAIAAGFREVVFTGSATEANNLALRGAVRGAIAAGIRHPRMVVSSVEHESVLDTARDLERDGVEVVYAPVDKRGIVDLARLKAALSEPTILVSIMYANNEVGSVQPIAEIAELVKTFREKNPGKYPLLHTDAAQAFQFLSCDASELDVDLMTISSHKIYGPKGVGALYVRDRKANISRLKPILSGGGQEFGLRSGTENVPAIVGFAKAVELAAAARAKETKRIGALRDQLWHGIKKIYPKAEMNGKLEAGNGLPNILNVYFPGRAAQDLLTKFDLAGLAVSSGSACRSRAMEPSYVIEALGYSKERAKASIRFSLGRPTTKADIVAALGTARRCLTDA